MEVVITSDRAGAGIRTGIEIDAGAGAEDGAGADVSGLKAVIGFEFGVWAGAGIRTGVAVSDLKVAIGSVAAWVETASSRACTAHLNSSAFSYINPGTAVPVCLCRFHIFWRTVLISFRL